VEILQKMPIMFYQESKTPFFKITFSSPKYVTQARSILESGLFVNGIESNLPYLTYESNIAYILRLMVDCGIGGASWLQLPAGKYRLITERRQCQTTVEASISYRDLIVYPVDDEDWGHIAPLRTVSFDIECAARPGTFPDPQIDPVIQIANYVSVHGQAKPILSNIFVLDTCTPIIGVDVRSYRTEKELLLAWSSFMRIVDPDIITGYNIVNFDLDYLKKRAARLDIDDFDLFSRHKEKRISMKESKFSSAQTGTRESKEWFIDGRIIFDMYQVLQRDHKLSSYTLNNVSAHFLKEQKEDVHHSMISVLHRGTPDDRRRLAIYCCKDALLPQKLIDSLMCLVNYVEMARVTGVPFAYLLSRGQSIKVTSQILRKAMHMDILLPTTKAESNGQDSFEGAKVMDPVPGLYEEPIPTLDFSSLYPTIIQAHNLCYTTFIPLGIKIPDDVVYETTPIGERFVTNSQKPGILPLILTDLLNARGRAKKLMFDAEKAKDKFKVQVYNGRQLALKVSANSVYGFTGQAHSGWPCLQISSSVTAYGRQMIMLTKDIVEEHYSIKNGWHCDTRVIYGDTDSVMVSAGLPSVEAAIKMGKEAAAMVSKRFPSPIKLEFEKVYFPYLLMSKKKYAGLFWTKSDRYDKLDCKGIESVRRDNCGIVRHVVDTVLRKILIDRDRKAAEMYVIDTHTHTHSLSLILTSSLSSIISNSQGK
jgi:DNA polymerase delta subunit 1